MCLTRSVWNLWEYQYSITTDPVLRTRCPRVHCHCDKTELADTVTGRCWEQSKEDTDFQLFYLLFLHDAATSYTNMCIIMKHLKRTVLSLFFLLKAQMVTISPVQYHSQSNHISPQSMQVVGRCMITCPVTRVRTWTWDRSWHGLQTLQEVNVTNGYHLNLFFF